MTIRLAIAGAAGRMGRTLIAAARDQNDLTVVGGSEAPDGLARSGELGLTLSEDAGAAASEADVWIDFTSPLVTLSALDALTLTPVRAAIIGTTGFSAEEDDAISKHAERIAIVKAGNFSLGVNLMNALIEQAAQRLGADWDIEIHEAHHRHKADAPSGTALMMGDAAARGRGSPLADLRLPPADGITGPRKSGGIGFSVTRAGGIVGDHTAAFASDAEVLSISHRALDRSIFARGAIEAARWAVERPPGLYSMRDVLSL